MLSNLNVINPVRSQWLSVLQPTAEISEGTVAQIDRNSLLMKVKTFSFKIKRGTVAKLEPHTNYIQCRHAGAGVVQCGTHA